ncbi:hypothetical protein, partial [Burkholderia pseudomallei]|uniref:hypothetical protein n=1 Tax=Burkholderia pseudomallei TaxID=28450 RepID=UPI0019561343
NAKRRALTAAEAAEGTKPDPRATKKRPAGASLARRPPHECVVQPADPRATHRRRCASLAPAARAAQISS